ncbi:MAG: hypothetical protein C0397_02355 [Odoribacter sp.]|nr:hypothetical protein [Odoribacter sp.]
MNTIDVDKIEQTCISGFEDYLLANPIKVKTRIVITVKCNKILFKAYPDKVSISSLYNKEKVKINFEAQYELFEKIGLEDFTNVFVKTSFAFGYLRMDDDNSLHFEIESVSFNG